MSSPYRALLAAALVLSPLASPAAAQDGGSGNADEAVPLFSSLGDQYRNVTTDSRRAQAYFDQGLRLMYAFDTDLALRSFREAQRHDPDCAMCHWGEAWALSPYLNGRMGPEDEARAHEAVSRASDLVAEDGTAAERDLIAASRVRFAADPDPDTRVQRDSAYARAMREVAVAHPADDDILTLWAESMMLLRPRYEIRDLSDPQVRAIRQTLEEVLDRNLGHAGACHLYIHLMEMSPQPGAAEACADVLAERIPGASHIQHMPSHTYMWIGRYGDAVRANLDAWHVDQQGLERGMVPIYPAHNVEMLVFAANFDGQSAVALEAARNLVELRPSGAILVPETLTLFGRWDEILAEEELPEAPLARGGWHFARGLAHLRGGASDRARGELELVREMQSRVDGSASYRNVPHRELLSLAGLLLEGEIHLAAGRTEDAVSSFEEAVRLEDDFTYSEPEAWHLPARRFLGHALLEAGHASEAEAVYRAALEDHPDEGWSLFGLERALRDQGRARAARRVRDRFEEAWSRSDVWLRASRM